MKLESHGVNTRLQDGNKNQAVCFDLLNKNSVSLSFVKSFCNEMNISTSDFFHSYLQFHLLGEQTADFMSKDNCALVKASSRPKFGHAQALVTAAAWNQSQKRLAEIVEMFVEQNNVTTVIELLIEAFVNVDKNDYDRIRFILDQLTYASNASRTSNLSFDHVKLRRLLDVFSAYK